MSASGVRRPAESICCTALAGWLSLSTLRVPREFAVRAVLLRCRDCRHQTSVTAGTIFQDTRTSLRLWFQAIWWVVSQKNGVSALGLQRVLGLRAMRRPGRGCINCAAPW